MQTFLNLFFPFFYFLLWMTQNWRLRCKLEIHPKVYSHTCKIVCKVTCEKEYQNIVNLLREEPLIQLEDMPFHNSKTVTVQTLRVLAPDFFTKCCLSLVMSTIEVLPQLSHLNVVFTPNSLRKSTIFGALTQSCFGCDLNLFWNCFE